MKRSKILDAHGLKQNGEYRWGQPFPRAAIRRVALSKAGLGDAAPETCSKQLACNMLRANLREPYIVRRQGRRLF